MSSPFEPTASGQHRAEVEGSPYPQVPPPPPTALTAVSKRLHPAVLGVWALGGVRGIIFLLIAGSFNIFAALVIVLVGAVAGVARWLRFEWRLEDQALVIEQGVLQRQRRVIPLERIQSVESVRKLSHRLFGVVELRVESVGGGTTEGQLDALSPRDAAALRSLLLRKGGAQENGEHDDRAGEGEPLVRMRPRQLVLAGLTGGRVGVFAALIGFASQALGERVQMVTEAATEGLARLVGDTETLGIVAVSLMLLAAVLAFAFVLSVIATTVTFWDFQLTRDEHNLYTTRGLLDQRSGTIPLYRVQSVRMEENLARRALGLAAVRVEVAGQGGGAEETSLVLPLGPRADALALIDEILERDLVSRTTLEPMPPGARARRLVRAALATVLLTAALTWWFGASGLWGLLLAVPFGWLALASYRSLGHAEPDGLALARSGVWVRTTFVTPERNLQAVAVTSTPFQRRRDLATLVLHIARSTGGGGDPEVIDVSSGYAHARLLELAVASDVGTRRPRPGTGPVVRAEEPADRGAIRALYGDAEGADAPLPTGGDGLLEPLSLVVEDDGEVVGHTLLRPTRVNGSSLDAAVYTLGPSTVRPDRRDDALDEALVKGAVAIAGQHGAHRVLASGSANLYERAGFEAARAHGLEPTSGGHWMVRLLPADDGSAVGTVQPPDDV